jgi:hypothetical protein
MDLVVAGEEGGGGRGARPYDLLGYHRKPPPSSTTHAAAGITDAKIPAAAGEEQGGVGRGHLASEAITRTDGNKSLYLVLVGVIFLSILECF